MSNIIKQTDQSITGLAPMAEYSEKHGENLPRSNRIVVFGTRREGGKLGTELQEFLKAEGVSESDALVIATRIADEESIRDVFFGIASRTIPTPQPTNPEIAQRKDSRGVVKKMIGAFSTRRTTATQPIEPSQTVVETSVSEPQTFPTLPMGVVIYPTMRLYYNGMGSDCQTPDLVRQLCAQYEVPYRIINPTEHAEVAPLVDPGQSLGQ